jgi:hypothetical protein
VAALLPGSQPLRLFPNDFDDSSKVRRHLSLQIGLLAWLFAVLIAAQPVLLPLPHTHPPPPTAPPQTCTDAEVLRAIFPSFSLPTDGPAVSLLLLLSAIDCSSPRRGALLAFGGTDVAMDCGTQRLVLSGSTGTASYTLPSGAAAASSASAPLALLLTQAAGAFAVCVNGQALPPLSVSSDALLGQLASSSDLLGAGVIFGSRTDATRSARTDIAAAYVTADALACSSTRPGQPLQALQQRLDAAAATARQAVLTPPAVVVVAGQQGGADGVVNQPLQLNLSIASNTTQGTTKLKSRAILYGLAPAGCSAAQCGNVVVDVPPPAAAGVPATLTVTATYTKPGRYLARVEVTSTEGLITTHDHAFLVRKAGNPGTAPCCRHSAVPVAGQLGRPISDVRYRDPTSAAQAAALGWSAAYWQREDLEAERLFDFSVLAPLTSATPLAILTCQDTRMAGAGESLPGSFFPGLPVVVHANTCQHLLWCNCAPPAASPCFTPSLSFCCRRPIPVCRFAGADRHHPSPGPFQHGPQQAAGPGARRLRLGHQQRASGVPAALDWVARAFAAHPDCRRWRQVLHCVHP